MCLNVTKKINPKFIKNISPYRIHKINRNKKKYITTQDINHELDISKKK